MESLNFSFLLQKDNDFSHDLTFFFTDNLIKYDDFPTFLSQYIEYCQSKSMICEKYSIKFQNGSNFSLTYSVNFPLDRVFLYIHCTETNTSKPLNISMNITYLYNNLANSNENKKPIKLLLIKIVSL